MLAIRRDAGSREPSTGRRDSGKEGHDKDLKSGTGLLLGSPTFAESTQ